MLTFDAYFWCLVAPFVAPLLEVCGSPAPGKVSHEGPGPALGRPELALGRPKLALGRPAGQSQHWFGSHDGSSEESHKRSHEGSYEGSPHGESPWEATMGKHEALPWLPLLASEYVAQIMCLM